MSAPLLELRILARPRLLHFGASIRTEYSLELSILARPPSLTPFW